MVMRFKAATSTIPIVAITGDPVVGGIAASLARPGGNYTGATSDTGPEYHPKLLELLKEILPTVSTVGYIATVDQGSSGWETSYGVASRDAAERLGIRLIPSILRGFEEADYRSAFETIAQNRVDAVLLADKGGALCESAPRRRAGRDLQAAYDGPFYRNCGDRGADRIFAGSQGAVPIHGRLR
jgi:putative ABC transport system substrate-binding protein